MGLCFGKNNNNELEKESSLNVNFENIQLKEIKKEFDELEELKNIKDKEVPYFTFKGKRLKCRYCNIYDGDTFTIIFIYNGEKIKYKARCLGYDTPEMKPPLKQPDREKEIEAAKKAKARFTELLDKSKDNIIEVECFEFDKYGRILVNVYNGIDNDSLNNIMIKEGHGKPYDGGTKEKFNFD